MKKICLILAVIMSFVSVSDFIAIGGNDSSTMSLFYSFTIITSPSAVSMELSEASDRNKIKTVEENYEYHKRLMDAENIMAKDVFSKDLIEKFGLNENDRMELSETKVGIIISDKNKALAFIPAKQEYADLIKSNERNIK